MLAVDEDDRRFAEPGAEPLQPPEDFFLKRIAAAADGVEIELGQHRHAVAAERAAAILRPQAEQPAGVEVHRAAHQLPPQRPALDAAAGDVARADHHVDRRAVGGSMPASSAGRYFGWWLKSASMFSTYR